MHDYECYNPIRIGSTMCNWLKSWQSTYIRHTNFAELSLQHADTSFRGSNALYMTVMKDCSYAVKTEFPARSSYIITKRGKDLLVKQCTETP